jgi:hypothetical protein
MGANAQTSVPLFVANSVLTAAQQNISAATGVPVFATTVTRDAAFGGSNKVLAEGQLCYLESTDVVQQYNGSSWITVGPATAGALTLITAQTIGTAVASVAVTGVFSSTYDNYKIVISGGTASVNDENCGMTLGATTTGYYAGYVGPTYSTAAVSSPTNNNASSWTRIVGLMTNGLNANLELNGPNLAKRTFITGFHVQDTVGRSYAGYVDNTTQYTAFTITPASGTLTGGTIRVYGYSNS